jgi:Ca2+:H+ antiporter
MSYLAFTMITHRSLIEDAPDLVEHDPSEKKRPLWVLIAQLLVISVLAVLLSDVLIETIEPAAAAMGLNQVFMGVIVLGVIGNVSGLVTAVSAARKDRMDLAFNVAVGSSVQQILFVIPVLVFMSYFVGPQPLDLAFSISTMVIMLLSVVTMGTMIGDGQSNWLKGAMLLSLFFILIAAILILS